MSVIININSVQPAPLARVPSAPQSPFHAPTRTTSIDGDSVELSKVGRALARAVDESSFRLARVRSIRSEIEAGTYETANRLDGTVSRMLDVLA